MDPFAEHRRRVEGRMKSLENISSHVNSKKMQGSVEEDRLYEVTLRRAKEDPEFRFYFVQALIRGDDAYISRIFGGLRTDYPSLSALIKKERESFIRRVVPRTKGKSHSFFPPGEEAWIAQVRRKECKSAAERFRRQYYFGRGMDQKTFVWADGTLPWTDNKSSGVTWLGVHGIDSICVVTMARDLDMERVHSTLKYITVEAVLFHLRKTIISEIEDLADSSSMLGVRFGESIPKPFGVVSLALGTDDVDEESDLMESSDEEEKEKRKKRREYMPRLYDERETIIYLREQMRKETPHTNNGATKVSSTVYHESKAIDFLQEKMKMAKLQVFTVDETIKIAIAAFQDLFQKEFKSDEIGVSVMDPNYSIKMGEEKTKDVHVKRLEMHEIEGHLAVINEAAGSVDSFERRLRPRLRLRLE